MKLNKSFWGISARVATLFVYLFTLVAPLTSLSFNLDNSEKVTASEEYNVLDSIISKHTEDQQNAAVAKALSDKRAAPIRKMTTSSSSKLDSKVTPTAVDPSYQAPVVTDYRIDTNVTNGVWGAYLAIEDNSDVYYAEIALYDEYGSFQKSFLITDSELLNANTVTCPAYGEQNGTFSNGTCIVVGDVDNSEFKRNFDVSDIPSGTYTVQSYLEDYSGNYSFDDLPTTVTIDNSYRDYEAPIFSYFTGFAVDGTIYLSYDLEDQFSLVSGANYVVKNSLGEVIKTGNASESDIYYSSNPYFYAYSPTYYRYFASEENASFNKYGYYWIDTVVEVPEILEQGTYEVTVCATDSLGNTSTVESGLCESFEYVNQTPIVEAVASPKTISPINQDGLADVSNIDYSISVIDGFDYFTTIEILDVTTGSLIELLYSDYISTSGTGIVTWDGMDTAGNYVADGDYYYFIWVEDSYGNLGYAYDFITVDNTMSDYTLELVTSESTLPSPANFTFKATAGEDVEFAWDLDADGSFFDVIENGTESTQEYTYFDSGDYKVGVKITDVAGNSEILYVTVTVIGDEPILKLTAKPGLSVDEGTNVSIVADIAGLNKPFGMVWLGDCDLTEVTDGSYTYELGALDMGTYTCSVLITDQDGDTDNESITITVNNAVPTVSIDIDPVSPLEGDTVTLTANAVGGNGSSNAYTYLWSGNCTGTDKKAVLADLPIGNYACTVVVTDADGDIAEKSIEFTVAENAPVVTIDQGAIINLYEGFLLTLDSTVVGGNDPIAYLWSGDCTGDMKSADFNATALGTYSCTVTVTDVDGDTDSFTSIINVLNYVPEVSLTVAPATPKEGDFVTIFSTVTGGNRDYTYLWSGNCSGTTANAELGNLLAGSYSCTLVVTDADGDTDTATVSFEVKDFIPVIKISADPGTAVNQGTAVKLTADVTGGNLPYKTGTWSGSCNGSSNSFTLPTAAGVYVCTYTIRDVDNDLASASITVTVKAPVVTPVDPKPVVKPVIVDPVVEDDDVLGEKTDEDTTIDEDKDNEDKCEQKELSGVIYLDINRNGDQDKGEEGIKDVKFELYEVYSNGTRGFIKLITTDKNGKWSVDGCYGKYQILIVDGLSNDFEIENSDLKMDLDQDQQFAVPVLDQSEKGMSPWIWVGIIAFAVVLGVAAYAVAKKEQ